MAKIVTGVVLAALAIVAFFWWRHQPPPHAVTLLPERFRHIHPPRADIRVGTFLESRDAILPSNALSKGIQWASTSAPMGSWVIKADDQGEMALALTKMFALTARQRTKLTIVLKDLTQDSVDYDATSFDWSVIPAATASRLAAGLAFARAVITVGEIELTTSDSSSIDVDNAAARGLGQLTVKDASKALWKVTGARVVLGVWPDIITMSRPTSRAGPKREEARVNWQNTRGPAPLITWDENNQSFSVEGAITIPDPSAWLGEPLAIDLPPAGPNKTYRVKSSEVIIDPAFNEDVTDQVMTAVGDQLHANLLVQVNSHGPDSIDRGFRAIMRGNYDSHLNFKKKGANAGQRTLRFKARVEILPTK